MPIENWFSTPIYYGFARDEHFNEMQKELLHLDSVSVYGKAYGGENADPTWGTNTHSITTPIFLDNVICNNNLIVTENEILWHLEQYVPEHASSGHISASWLTRNAKGEYAHKHKHGGNSDISGCYYVKTNEQDGDIRFWNNNELSNDFCFYADNQKIKYTPRVGKILLFPSWLMHEVTENHTDNIRISLAFNIVFDRD